jgi:tRNA-dependent cyclodipeptide synthase
MHKKAFNNSNNNQYPAQTGPYKVHVKDKARWQNHNVARLQISMDNLKHQGAKFAALTEWAANRFDKVIVIVSDTLNRHNIIQNYDMNDKLAYEVSKAIGDNWLEANQGALDNIPEDKIEIKRWDDYLQHEKFDDTRALLSDMYHMGDKGFKEAVCKKSDFFCQRNGQVGSAFARMSSNAYILEELACFAIMFEEDKAIDWFEDIFEEIKKVNRSKLLESFQSAECMRVDFTKNKSYRPELDYRPLKPYHKLELSM